MKTMLFRVLACVTLLSTVGLADTIKLKNGSVIKGKVTTYNDREFTVSLDLGSASKRSTSRMVIAVEDIESIQFDTDDFAQATSPAPTESTQRPPAPVVKEPSTARSLNQPTDLPATPTYANTPTKSAPTSDETGFDKTVIVPAAADWTSTELKVKKGQRITIQATGQVDLGNNRTATPNGIPLSDPKRLILTSPTGALIAVIGDDNDEFIHVGSQTEFVAERDGVLFLSVNEGNLKDNGGSFSAKVKVR